MATQSKPPAASSAPNYLVPFITVTALFGIFGFLTNLNSNLSPKLEDIFNLNHMWSNFVTTSWFLAYLVFSVPSGKLIEKIGYKRTMVTSLFIMVIGALLFKMCIRDSGLSARSRLPFLAQNRPSSVATHNKPLWLSLIHIYLEEKSMQSGPRLPERGLPVPFVTML